MLDRRSLHSFVELWLAQDFSIPLWRGVSLEPLHGSTSSEPKSECLNAPVVGQAGWVLHTTSPGRAASPCIDVEEKPL